MINRTVLISTALFALCIGMMDRSSASHRHAMSVRQNNGYLRCKVDNLQTSEPPLATLRGGRRPRPRQLGNASAGKSIQNFFQTIVLKIKYFLRDYPDFVVGLLLMTILVVSVACAFGFFACLGACIYECCLNLCPGETEENDKTNNASLEKKESETDKDDETPEGTDTAELYDDFETIEL